MAPEQSNSHLNPLSLDLPRERANIIPNPALIEDDYAGNTSQPTHSFPSLPLPTTDNRDDAVRWWMHNEHNLYVFTYLLKKQLLLDVTKDEVDWLFAVADVVADLRKTRQVPSAFRTDQEVQDQLKQPARFLCAAVAGDVNPDDFDGLEQQDGPSRSADRNVLRTYIRWFRTSKERWLGICKKTILAFPGDAPRFTAALALAGEHHVANEVLETLQTTGGIAGADWTVNAVEEAEEQTYINEFYTGVSLVSSLERHIQHKQAASLQKLDSCIKKRIWLDNTEPLIYEYVDLNICTNGKSSIHMHWPLSLFEFVVDAAVLNSLNAALAGMQI
jgi:hypothetical protein